MPEHAERERRPAVYDRGGASVTHTTTYIHRPSHSAFTAHEHSERMLGAVLFATAPLAGQQRMPLAWQRVQRLLHMPKGVRHTRLLLSEYFPRMEWQRSASTFLRSCCCRRSKHRQSKSFSTVLHGGTARQR